VTLAIKIWFCLAVAMIAASVADPLIEFASNDGWFGAGTFTDMSNWNVVPALLIGLIFVGFHVYLRIRSALVAERPTAPSWLQIAGRTLCPRAVLLIPLIFAMQVFALYLIETFEQFVVYGHALGGTLWLGGPIGASLIAHAIVCGVVTVVSARVLRVLAEATVSLVRLVRAFARLCARDAMPTFLGRLCSVDFAQALRVRCNIGERAPPTLTA
jgi:hypothetical protein